MDEAKGENPRTGRRGRECALIAVALVLHLPGLKILFDRTPPRRVLHANVVALLATAVAVVLAGVACGVTGICAAWVAGHFLWGLYLARWVTTMGR